MTGPREPREYEIRVCPECTKVSLRLGSSCPHGDIARVGWERVAVVEKDLHREAVAREIAQAIREHYGPHTASARVAAFVLGFCPEEGSP